VGFFRKNAYFQLVVRPGCGLALTVLAALTPFLWKPLNMDDPLFVWTARHIQQRPLNPYGFEVNWYGTAQPMWEVTKNPPLACYYLTVAGLLLGWGELGLHAALLLPALAVILGTHRLARRFCKGPGLAALVTLASPAFLVSGTTVMCDVLMLAFWVWAMVLWGEGTAGTNHWKMPTAALLMALAIMCKYFAISLIPLAAAYCIFRKQPLKRWGPSLMIPVGGLAAYHLATRALYSRSLLADVLQYTAVPSEIGLFLSSKAGGLLTSLVFTGGCLAGVVFFAPILWRWRKLAWMSAAAALFAVLMLASGVILKGYGPLIGTTRLLLEAQIVFWAAGGTLVLALAIADIRERRDAEGWLLGLWVLGTFLFAALFNWTVNGRTILPMAPAVGILLVRRLERRYWGRGASETQPDSAASTNVACGAAALRSFEWPRSVWMCLCLSAALALWVTQADFLLAKAVRRSAEETSARYGHGPQRLYFQGHWGFQYYMEALGVAAADEVRTVLKAGDLVAQSVNNGNYSPLKPELVQVRDVVRVPASRWLATMQGSVGAGFYASVRGPLPFAFGCPPPEEVVVLSLGR
jgi:4-amino-4-deoxy-L-arabinose transferase-like glycosyltransferase